MAITTQWCRRKKGNENCKLFTSKLISTLIRTLFANGFVELILNILLYRYNQYFFRCDCLSCNQNWPTYQNLPTNLVPLSKSGSDSSSTLSADQKNKILMETNKLSKSFRKTFESVLLGSFNDSIPILADYLYHLDNYISRPLREYNDCQEALKQCYSVTANVHHPRSNKKDSKDAA